MKRVWPAALAILAMQMPAVAAQQGDIVVRGDVARTEIERILRADNVDTSRLGAREVAEAIAAIERGRAPDDFWAAYQAHVRAWEQLADAEEKGAKDFETGFGGTGEVAKAARAIDFTFDQVERIARDYGARLPIPRWSIAPTV